MTGEQTGAPRRDLEELLAALAGGDDEPGAAAAEAAVDDMRALAPPESAAALDRLAQLAADPNPDRRWWAIRALTALPHVDVLPLLIQALADPDAAVRQSAALGLRLRPGERAASPLIQALEDPDPLTARLAIDALVAIGSEAVPALLEALAPRRDAAAGESGTTGTAAEAGTPSPALRISLLRALATIGDTRAIPALFAALDGSTLEEYWASAGIERMGVGMSFFKP